MSAYRVAPGANVDLATAQTLPAIADYSRTALLAMLAERVQRFAELQQMLYAESRQALLLIFQGMDAAGKDSTIKHVTTGVNPQGFRVTNFRAPTYQDIEHSYLRRHWLALPERGHIGIFNRSHYEEVVTVRVHPKLLDNRKLPSRSVDEAFWNERMEDIVAFERHLVRNGTAVAKFFLNISKKEQKARLLERVSNRKKHWKFDLADLQARRRWKQYRSAYEAALQATSTAEAPWYIVPADGKPAMRVIVASIIVETLSRMNPSYPEPDASLKAEIEAMQKSFGG